MMPLIHRLKALSVERLTAPGMYADGAGLYLQVARGGSKSWIFRYRLDAREREMGLGPLHTVSLAEAREAALEARKLKLRGIDPIEARRSAAMERRIDAARAAKALEFTILTAARTSEVIKATWQEIDIEAAVWTLPGHRMKGGREHRVPLSAGAVTLLRALPVGAPGAPIFQGRGPLAPLSNMAMLKTLERMNRSDLTVHGFRSTFRDWAAETTEYPNEVVEMALAHTVANKVEAAYRRGDLFTKRQEDPRLSPVVSPLQTLTVTAVKPADAPESATVEATHRDDPQPQPRRSDVMPSVTAPSPAPPHLPKFFTEF